MPTFAGYAMGAGAFFFDNMNKLPWFKHSNTAHDDPLIYDLMSEFGHFGYSAYFMILELLHAQGKGDILTITPQQLCFILRTKPKQIRNYLRTIQERSRNKVETKWDDSRNEVRIEVKNFRKYQHNSKSKSGSKAVEKRIEGEVEREVEEEKIKDLGQVVDKSNPYVKANEANAPKGFLPSNPISFCEYYDKGQGKCDSQKAPRSKYCEYHKLKVHDKYLAKAEMRSRDIQSSAEIIDRDFPQ